MRLFFTSLILLALTSCYNTPDSSSKEINIPILTKGNSWVYNNPIQTLKTITDNGIENWNSTSTIIRTYFKVEKTGIINIALYAKVEEGESVLNVKFNGESKKIELNNNKNFKEKFIGSFHVDKPGYQYIELQGEKKTSTNFAKVSNIMIGGEATEGSNYYVKEDFYWGRRGPSVHLSYTVPPETGDVLYFYNEMTVPEGNDVVGSYYMANGFSGGYFGIQVNSETERRILFSIWSPYKTDDPNSIPEDQRVKLLNKGKDVITNDFGNEGSGGQSRKIFDWKAGNKYKFLLKAHPSENNSTDFTAYFYAPEVGKWELIASFRRPKTSTYIKQPHSFLENFLTEMGDKERKVYYGEQWIYDTAGNWYEMTEAKFTADATAHKESRLDYSGGLSNGTFYLKNCGFFNETTTINTVYNKSASTRNNPEVDLEKLP
ncbi:MAG: DUF3472 domain-containing protein [Bacteroidota bacterium]